MYFDLISVKVNNKLLLDTGVLRVADSFRCGAPSVTHQTPWFPLVCTEAGPKNEQNTIHGKLKAVSDRFTPHSHLQEIHNGKRRYYCPTLMSIYVSVSFPFHFESVVKNRSIWFLLLTKIKNILVFTILSMIKVTLWTVRKREATAITLNSGWSHFKIKAILNSQVHCPTIFLCRFISVRGRPCTSILVVVVFQIDWESERWWILMDRMQGFERTCFFYNAQVLNLWSYL